MPSDIERMPNVASLDRRVCKDCCGRSMIYYFESPGLGFAPFSLGWIAPVSRPPFPRRDGILGFCNSADTIPPTDVRCLARQNGFQSLASFAWTLRHVRSVDILVHCVFYQSLFFSRNHLRPCRLQLLSQSPHWPWVTSSDQDAAPLTSCRKQLLSL